MGSLLTPDFLQEIGCRILEPNPERLREKDILVGLDDDELQLYRPLAQARGWNIHTYWHQRRGWMTRNHRYVSSKEFKKILKKQAEKA